MEDSDRAKSLEMIAERLKNYARVVRGEEDDLTGLGQWRMICEALERCMDCKILSKHQYESVKELWKKEHERLLAERDAKILDW